MFTPEQFKEKSANLSEIVGKQLNVTSASGIDDANQNSKPSEVLSEVKKRLQEGSLRVLVMGKFSSGKSTFLNAMMGKMLLPAKPTPTTAVIGEIQYAHEPSATLYPKKQTGKAPFDVQIDDLDKYIVINHEEKEKDDEKKENPYEKIVIKYPLNICKMGIDFVDSPGLDDPTCHDAITLNYLPTADAIVYCMNSQSAFSALDKAEIEHLRALGYKSIIFVLTYFDMLEQNDIMTGKHDAEDTRRHYTNVLSPYTDLGPEGIFFVGSLPALMGKIKNDMNLLESSHLPKMEKKLEQILFNERGRLKLIKAIYSVKKVNRETRRFLSDKIELYKQDQTSLSGKLNSAQSNLDKAKEKARLISTSFKNGATEIVEGTKDRARSFFLSGILPNVESWVQECNPEQGISMWHPKRTGTEFAESCMKFLQTKIETAMSSWCQDELVPKYRSPRLKDLVEQQGSSLKAYENDLKNVRGSLSLSIETEGPQISALNRIGSAIAGIGPGGAVVGGLLGWEGLLPALIAQLVAGLVLGIVAMFNPVSFPVVVITAVVSALIGGGLGTIGIESKLKKKLGAKAKEELSKQQEAFVLNISGGVKNITDKAGKAVEDNLNAPVNQYQKLLDDAKRDVNAQGTTIENQIITKNAMLKDNNAIADELEDFGHEININI